MADREVKFYENVGSLPISYYCLCTEKPGVDRFNRMRNSRLTKKGREKNKKNRGIITGGGRKPVLTDPKNQRAKYKQKDDRSQNVGNVYPRLP